MIMATSPDENIQAGNFHPFEVTPAHLVYVGLGLFIVIFGMFSLFIKERLYLGEAPLAAVFGIIVGPAALGLFEPDDWGGRDSEAPGGHITNEISLEVFRVTIALSVFAVGVELPKKYLLRHWRSIAFLLGPVMIFGWLVTASLMYALIPGLDFLNSLVVASCVTPTDPILAQAVVGGPWAEKHVPAHLRHMLMCESGCNDGAAFPFLYLALFLTTNRDNRGKAIAEWFYDALAYQIVFGTILGALIGWAARKLMRFSERHKLVDRESFVAQYVSLAIASMGVNTLLGSDDLLAAFACGTAFAWDGWFTKQTEDSNFSSIVDLLFNVAVFIYIGSLMPYRQWAGGTDAEPNTLTVWRLFVLAICVLIVKRIPVVIALWRWIPDIKTFREAVFAGHFGPIGVGAVFIATLARTQLPEEVPNPPQTSNDILALTVQPVIYFFVLCSIAVHGLTIPFFAFSKGASKLTRTMSRNPSFALDREPTWVARLRRSKTGESTSPKEGEEGGMSEIERVLNAQLRQVGRGAIGGDAEKDMDRTDSGQETGSSSETAADKKQRRPVVDDDFDGDDCPQQLQNLEDDWDGDDTAEARRYKEKLLAQKRKEYETMRARQNLHDEEEQSKDSVEGDVGMRRLQDEPRGPMDRDVPRASSQEREQTKQSKSRRNSSSSFDAGTHAAGAIFGKHVFKSDDDDDEAQEREHAELRKKNNDQWPRSRSWVEGSKIVIEHQKGPSSDVECHVIPILDHERQEIENAESPAHAWILRHADAIEHHVGLEGVSGWHPSESLNKLMHHRIPYLYNEYLKGGQTPARRGSVLETQKSRDERSSMMMDAMSWASQRREAEAKAEDERKSRSSTKMPIPRSQKDKSGKRVNTPSPPETPVTGWLAPKPGNSKRRRAGAAKPRTGSPKGDDDNACTVARVAREHRCASEARRRNLTRKILAGRIGLSADDNESEEIVDSIPGDDRGLGFPRSPSAGGLGIDRFNRSMTQSTSGSRLTAGSIGLPRSKSTSDDQSSAFSGRERTGGIQWVDETDFGHDRDSQSSASAAKQRAITSDRSTLARMIGKEFSASSGLGANRQASDQEGSSESGVDDDEEQSGGRSKRRSRIASFFSSLSPIKAQRETADEEAPAPQDHSSADTPEQSDDRFPRTHSTQQPQSLQSDVPTYIVGTGSGPSERGGILSTGNFGPSAAQLGADGGNGSSDNPRATSFEPGESEQQDAERADRAVTFDLS